MQRVRSATQKIARQYRPDKIILFGSYAYGAPEMGSDVDLLVVKTTQEKFLKRSPVIRKLLSWEEDAIISPLVLTPDEIAERLNRGDQFIAEILQRGKVLYEA